MSERLLGWPDARQVRHAAWLWLLVTGWFVLVFVGADRLTASHTYRLTVHHPAELAIPLVPWMVVPYMSIYVLFLAAPFVVREVRGLNELASALALTILVAGICFVLFPAELAFPPPRVLGVWAGPIAVADRLNLDYNLLPSLHVALSVVCVATYAERAPAAVGVALWVWAVTVGVSTVLIHQHHVIDVPTGWALALAARALVRRRASRMAS